METIRFTLSFFAALIGLALIVPLAIITLPFWLVSSLVRTVDKLRSASVMREDINEFDDQLGWRPKKNVRALMETDGLYHLTTGADGWRGNFKINESNTIVIGDSFVFGRGVNDKKYFANLTKDAKVKPMGAQGYGAVQYLLLLKTLTSELKGKLVIWFVFTGNDYRESIRPNAYGRRVPFVFFNNKSGKWEIQADNIIPQKLPFNSERSYKISIPEIADLYSKNYLSDYAYEAFEYLAGEGKKHCQKHSAEFAIVTIPLWWTLDEKSASFKLKRNSGDEANFSAKYPDEKTAEICQRKEIIFKQGIEQFGREDYLPNDLHWSTAGNKKAAKIIDDLYKSFCEKIL